jgi:acetyl-CoA acetyltransferase
MGGASGVVALRRAARAVQAGDVDVVACIAGDANRIDSFRQLLSSFSRFAMDASYPYGSGGPNASFALIADAYMAEYGVTREDFGRIAVAQRTNALAYPNAIMKSPLTLEQYLSARPISEPFGLFDCVMPCAGAEGFLVMREEEAQSRGLAYARISATIERHNAFPEDPVQLRGGWAMDIDELYEMAGCGPEAIDLLETYDDYPIISMMQFEDLGFCGKGRGGAVRPGARSDDHRRLPAQHVGWTAVRRAGGGRRWLSRTGRGDKAGDRPGGRHPGRQSAHGHGVGVRHDQL